MRRRATERMKESLHARLDVQVKGKTWHNIRVNYKAFLVKYKPEDTSSVWLGLSPVFRDVFVKSALYC